MIHFVYTIMQGLWTMKINVGKQKIDKSYLDIFGIVIVDYSVKNNLKKIGFI